MKNLKLPIILAVIIIGAVILGGAIRYWYSRTPASSPAGEETVSPVVSLLGSPKAALPSASPTPVTKATVPPDVKVPEVGEKPANTAVAIPVVVRPASPYEGVSAKYRGFAIKAENNLFSPSTIIAGKMDIIHIDFTAVDKAYDFIFPDYGMKGIVQKGETKILEFQAVTEGKFTFYCDACGGLNSSAKGYIIIAP